MSVTAGVEQRRKLRISISAAGAVGAVIVASAILVALFAPWLSPHDPTKVNIALRLKPPSWMDGGAQGYLLGTDQLGRDLLSRILYGARTSLLVAVSATLVSAVFGSLMGLIASHFGRWVDQAIMRIVDIQLAFPPLLLAITIMAVAKPSLYAVIAVLAISGWVEPCRLIRSRALSLGQQDFVQAAIAAGANDWRIIIRHLWPNVLPTLIIVATLQAAQFVLTEAALSFLGLGLPPAIPSWGVIMNEGRPYMEIGWWIETFSGLTLALLILGLGMLGNWIRDLLDPRLRG